MNLRAQYWVLLCNNYVHLNFADHVGVTFAYELIFSRFNRQNCTIKKTLNRRGFSLRSPTVLPFPRSVPRPRPPPPLTKPKSRSLELAFEGACMNEASCAATVVQRADESRSRTCVSWWEGQKRVLIRGWRRRRRRRRKIGTLQRCITIGTLYFHLASPTTNKINYLEEMKINAWLTTAHYRQKQRTRVASSRQLVSPSHVFLENNKIAHNIQH